MNNTLYTKHDKITGVNVMSVTDIPRWRMRIQVRINIIAFVKIMNYSSVFHVLIDVSLNMKLKYNEALS